MLNVEIGKRYKTRKGRIVKLDWVHSNPYSDDLYHGHFEDEDWLKRAWSLRGISHSGFWEEDLVEEYFEPWQIKAKTCVCDIRDLMLSGCKCGYLKKDKK
jgi:hypothetical protein